MSSKGLNHNDGILADASSVQCGDGAEAAYATWVSTSGSVYSIEATITASGKLLELDFFADTSDQLGPSRRRDTGKTLSLLAIELMPEVLDV